MHRCLLLSVVAWHRVIIIFYSIVFKLMSVTVTHLSTGAVVRWRRRNDRSIRIRVCGRCLRDIHCGPAIHVPLCVDVGWLQHCCCCCRRGRTAQRRARLMMLMMSSTTTTTAVTVTTTVTVAVTAMAVTASAAAAAAAVMMMWRRRCCLCGNLWRCTRWRL